MEFLYTPIRSLPPLAWCLRLRRGSPWIEVEHGPGVETNRNFFCEGAWSDPSFLDGGFPEAPVFVGSGARLDNRQLTLSTSTNTIERLQALRIGDELIVSNSLVFLLVRADDEPDPMYKSYEWDFASIINGVKKCVSSVPTRYGKRVNLFYHCNVLVDSSLQVRRAEKKDPPPFPAFADFRAFLFAEVTRLCANARSSERSVRYEPLATVSTGYDSPTAALLAAHVGCTEAVTFRSPRPEFGSEDRGTAIAEKLGLRVCEFERLAYLSRRDHPEAEFLANGLGGDDVVFSAFEPLLGRRILFTGFHGDKAWERTNRKVSPEIVRGDPTGGSMQEFRLRVGFLHLPVPFIGCTRHVEVHRVSNSVEMAPWRTKVPDYDRPIPRRILEEASVPREWFGQSKRAVSVNFPPLGDTHDLTEIMSPKSIEDYQHFAEQIPLYRGLGERFCVGAAHLAYEFALRIVWRLDKWFGMQSANEWVSPQRFSYSRVRTLNFVTFHWAFSKVQHRYAVTGYSAIPKAESAQASWTA